MLISMLAEKILMLRRYLDANAKERYEFECITQLLRDKLFGGGENSVIITPTNLHFWLHRHVLIPTSDGVGIEMSDSGWPHSVLLLDPGCSVHLRIKITPGHITVEINRLDLESHTTTGQEPNNAPASEKAVKLQDAMITFFERFGTIKLAPFGQFKVRARACIFLYN